MEYPEASGGREAIPEEIRKVRAGGACEVRAGGARKILEAEEIADKTRREEGGVVDNFTEGDEFPEEDAAVLERLQHSSKRLE